MGQIFYTTKLRFTFLLQSPAKPQKLKVEGNALKSIVWKASA